MIKIFLIIWCRLFVIMSFSVNANIVSMNYTEDDLLTYPSLMPSPELQRVISNLQQFNVYSVTQKTLIRNSLLNESMFKAEKLQDIDEFYWRNCNLFFEGNSIVGYIVTGNEFFDNFYISSLHASLKSSIIHMKFDEKLKLNNMIFFYYDFLMDEEVIQYATINELLMPHLSCDVRMSVINDFSISNEIKFNAVEQRNNKYNAFNGGVHVVPLPVSVWLLGSGLVSLFCLLRNKK